MNMKRLLVCVASLLVFLPALASAQGVAQGTVEITGITGFVGTFQTISPQDSEEDVDLKNVASVIGVFYYPAAMVGVGVVGTFNRVTATIDQTDLTASSTLIGPEVKIRFGQERVSLAVIGGGGYAKTKVEATGADFEGVEDAEFQIDGFYWEAGGQVDYFLNDFASLNAGARYQSASVSDPDENKLDVSGFSVGVGFSLYLGQ